MTNKLVLLFVTLTLISLIFLFSCFGSRSVTIAVAAPLSGDDKDEGESIVKAVTLCVDEWNSKGGLFGKPIELITKDDKDNPETALRVANELCRKKVTAVIGHYISSCTLAARDKYFENRILMITPSSTNPAITDGIYPTIFRVCGRDDAQGITAANYIFKTIKDAKVALLHDESRYGKDLADRFLSEFSSLSKSESVLYKHFDRSIVDFTQIAKEIKEKEPNVIYFGGVFTQGAELLKAVRREGSNAIFVSGDGCYHPLFIEKATPQMAEGSIVTFANDPEATPLGKEFKTKYKAKFGSDPKPYAIYAYAAAEVALKAISKANTKDSIAISKVIHSEEFETPIGKLKFDKKGDVESSVWSVWKVEGGKFVPAPPPPSSPPNQNPTGS